MSKVVIVESPAKAKTIKKYLGKDFEVLASMGHIRDLPPKRLGVDIKNDFKPKYEVIKDKKDVIEKLKKAVESSSQVFLATDPDREGEAISWHLAYVLNLDLNEKNRITFNEITKSGIETGMSSPRAIDIELVNAQQARRILDRIVGYQLSPFLSQKIERGLSAGRVQSVAVKMIVDREKAIRGFVPKEYWTIDATLSVPSDKSKPFKATFYGDKKGEIKIENKEQADKILSGLDNSDFIVDAIKKGTRQRTPAPPFITSTLQQEASRKLGYQSRRTMSVAQQLYEGVEIEGIGATGLITYMRTDSLRISNEAKAQARQFIENTFGSKYLPPKPREFKSKKGAQDAHEAIRPTNVSLTPEKVKGSLTAEQYKIYKLIWERFIASQMANCVHDTTSVEILAGDYIFRASGYAVKFDGFTVLYEEGRDEETEKSEKLPPLKEDEKLKLKKLDANQHFTQPPPRFTEATLIKALEENGIGRPSTYSAIISTILAREYVVREGRAFKPTELGEVATKLLEEHFSGIVDVKFTAQMEQQLDDVEEGKVDWVEALSEFYKAFEKALLEAKDAMQGVKIQLEQNETDMICELCGRKMVIKKGRFGKFIACSGYPECKNTKKLPKETIETGIICPKCQEGMIIGRKTKKGRLFYGCSTFPKCSFAVWDPPAHADCPSCGMPLFFKNGKKPKNYCSNCDYTVNLNPEEAKKMEQAVGK